METLIRKDLRNNYQAISSMKFGTDQIIRFSTSKTYSGAIVSHVSVAKVEGKFETHMMYKDYSKQFKATNIRCTAKNVGEQHQEMLTHLNQFVAEIKSHYGVN